MSVLADTAAYPITPATALLWGEAKTDAAGYLDLVGGRGPVGRREPGASGRR